MGRIMAWTAAGAMALSPLSGCAAAGAAPSATGETRTAAPCAPLEDDGIDYARVPANPAGLAERVGQATADHRQLRTAVGLPAAAPGDTVRILSWGSMLPGRTSIVATRNAAGGWEVEKVTDMARVPSKERTAEAPRLSRGRIEGEAAERLNRLVADRCLYREPGYFDRMAPTTDGGQAACADGADAVVEVEVGGRRHASFHACHTFGRAGEAAGVLWQAAE